MIAFRNVVFLVLLVAPALCVATSARYGESKATRAQYERRYVEQTNRGLEAYEAKLGDCGECESELAPEVRERAIALFGELYDWETAAVKAGEKVAMPRVIQASPPRHPTERRYGSYSGKTLAGIEVGKSGKVERIELLVETDPAIASEVTRSVKKWRFQPGTRNGEPVAMLLFVPFSFGAPGK